MQSRRAPPTPCESVTCFHPSLHCAHAHMQRWQSVMGRLQFPSYSQAPEIEGQRPYLARVSSELRRMHSLLSPTMTVGARASRSLQAAELDASIMPQCDFRFAAALLCEGLHVSSAAANSGTGI